MEMVLTQDATRGVYGISVTSELSGLDPQTLRLYERRGLLTPARTTGGTRRYSNADLARLRRIAELVGGGVNIAGIVQILDLEARNTQLQSDNTQLQSDNTQLQSDNTQLESDNARLMSRSRSPRTGARSPEGKRLEPDDR